MPNAGRRKQPPVRAYLCAPQCGAGLLTDRLARSGRQLIHRRLEADGLGTATGLLDERRDLRNDVDETLGTHALGALGDEVVLKQLRHSGALGGLLRQAAGEEIVEFLRVVARRGECGWRSARDHKDCLQCARAQSDAAEGRRGVPAWGAYCTEEVAARPFLSPR